MTFWGTPDLRLLRVCHLFWIKQIFNHEKVESRLKSQFVGWLVYGLNGWFMDWNVIDWVSVIIITNYQQIIIIITITIYQLIGWFPPESQAFEAFALITSPDDRIHIHTCMHLKPSRTLNFHGQGFTDVSAPKCRRFSEWREINGALKSGLARWPRSFHCSGSRR